MGITDFLSSAMEYLNLTEEAHADAPEKEDEEESKDEGGDEKEEKEGDGEGGDEEKEDGGEDEEKEEGGDDEEEEEEDEEAVDPKPALEEECAKSSQCRGYKHHYDECVERVTAAHENPDAHKGHHKEDCVEEFFHLQHCATACAAPKLFKQLK